MSSAARGHGIGFALALGAALALAAAAVAGSGRAAATSAVHVDLEAAARHGDGTDRPPVDFARDVRPILSDKCYACHGPDESQRKAGLRLDVEDGAKSATASGAVAVVPGALDDGELYWRITSELESERMPPPESGKSLEPEEIALLARWIEEGARWAQHWSLVAPQRPALPPVSRPAWVRNSIDAFVLARLDADGLEPSPDAARETLLRRVTHDLTGLPPTIAELDEFLADRRNDAYERVVDRLLASPRYGEHMARYWLDAARYGDTHGLHLDNERQMWPWRDWVIRALNDNLPYDQFVVEQLAGDLLPSATLEQRIASGFNRCNVTSAEGGMIAEEYLAKYAMDRADTTAAIFMGATMGCAQCHDHKFDPFTQREYYGMFAFFNSLAEEASDRNIPVPGPLLAVPSLEQAAELAALRGQIAVAEAALGAPMPEVDAAQERWEADRAARLALHHERLVPVSATSSGGTTLDVLDDGTIVASGENPDKDVYTLVLRTERTGITGLYLEALVPEGQSLPGRAHNQNFVLTELELDVRSASSASASRAEEPRRVHFERAEASFSQETYDVRGALDGDAETGWAGLGREGARTALFVPIEPFGAEGGSELVVTLRHESRFARHGLARLRLAISTDPALAPAERSAWHSAGPFPAIDRTEALQRDFGPEAGVDLSATYPGGLGWVEREDVDGQTHLFEGGLSAMYLFRTLTCDAPRRMRVGLGSDDALKVWLNDVLALERDVARAVALDQDFVTLELRPGENRLLLKVANFGGGFGYAFRVVSESEHGLPLELVTSLAAGAERSEADGAVLRAFYRKEHSPEYAAIESEIVGLRDVLQKLDAAVPRTMVSEELPTRRQAHVLKRGQYDQPGEPVEPGTPACLPTMPMGAPPNRLGLAEWLVSPEHPLTARVEANRQWQRFFGTGLVKTAEDFGAQGEFPSHPELLDWLAVELRDSLWDVKHVQRLMVTSAAYRQSARSTPELRRRDPANRLYARGPRHRLDAERIRDQALFLAGLLVERVGGKSVKPYQPTGIWKSVGYTSSNTANFVQDQGEALWRRSLYTFWKRTAPPPSMATFDAPSREACTMRRPRTNTPLQALVLLNDPQFVEAARHLGARVVREGGATDEERVTSLFRMATARRPDADERGVLIELLREARGRYAADPDGARALLAVGDSPPCEGAEPAELAAWATLASLVLNLDETITRG